MPDTVDRSTNENPFLEIVEDGLLGAWTDDEVAQFAAAMEKRARELYGGTSEQVTEVLRSAQRCAYGSISRRQLREDLASLVVPGFLPVLDEGAVKISSRDIAQGVLDDAAELIALGLAAVAESVRESRLGGAGCFPLLDMLTGELQGREVIPDALDERVRRIIADEDKRLADSLAARIASKLVIPPHSILVTTHLLMTEIEAALRERRGEEAPVQGEAEGGASPELAEPKLPARLWVGWDITGNPFLAQVGVQGLPRFSNAEQRDAAYVEAARCFNAFREGGAPSGILAPATADELRALVPALTMLQEALEPEGEAS